MTRSELSQLLARKFPQLTLADANMSVKTIIDAIANRLTEGGRVELRGFGSFSLNYRPPHKGRNPKTGERVDVPAKYVPHFKPGLILKNNVNIPDK